MEVLDAVKALEAALNKLPYLEIQLDHRVTDITELSDEEPRYGHFIGVSVTQKLR